MLFFAVQNSRIPLLLLPLGPAFTYHQNQNPNFEKKRFNFYPMFFCKFNNFLFAFVNLVKFFYIFMFLVGFLHLFQIISLSSSSCFPCPKGSHFIYEVEKTSFLFFMQLINYREWISLNLVTNIMIPTFRDLYVLFFYEFELELAIKTPPLISIYELGFAS